ncbi:TetR/AcrR family transcriptional regulator [Lactobacillus sp. PV034]|uniref:TetR/AcrR family transcriptional regulator n=1 Tax=Lactobacillus sp. PV034 TaxID=2594495 RepID=UPI00223EAA6A|nr:TetR family transcriptional regulator [Lactobacillus sp. PV034]QNQ81317.1 TetR/AcrR family transcriptional regulator [Lactobacillus sp. PV034]
MTQKRTLDRQKVINKATEIINDKGLSELTMPKLARALNVRSQSLYHYVSNRDELLSLVCAARLKILRTHLTENLIGYSGNNALYRFADEIRDFLLNDRTVSSIFYNINEYINNNLITDEINKVIELGEKLLDVDKKNTVSLHGLLAAVLGYVFLDRADLFKNEDKKSADDNYHELLSRLVTANGK